MARHKKAIFIGRDHPDHGLDEYKKLSKKFNLDLKVCINVPNAAKYLKNYDYAFVSGYLAILEALLAGIPVIAYYNTKIKHDYLTMTPFSRFIKIFHLHSDIDLNFDTILFKEGQNWAQTQTWDKLTDIYEQLWQKK